MKFIFWRYSPPLSSQYVPTFALLMCILLASLSVSARVEPFHPADINQNKEISEEEAANYIEGWRTGEKPLDYAIRAWFLKESGGVYSVNPADQAPMCWIPFDGSTARLILFGESEVFVECGSSYVDPGAEGQDFDGSLLSLETVIIKDGAPVEAVDSVLSSVGSEYIITYSAQTQSGETLSITRRVYVQDTEAPVILPAALQNNPPLLWPYGYKEFVFNWRIAPSGVHVHVVNCHADWAMIDSGTAFDSCGDGAPVDYWDDIELTVKRLDETTYEVEQDENGEDITLLPEEFTQVPGTYKIEYTVRDAAGNAATYTPPDYLRYVRVMDTTPVPILENTGLTGAEAETRAWQANLNPVITEEFRDGFRAGLVISQSIPAFNEDGKQNYVPCGTEIHIIVSKGGCNMPSILGLPLEQARTLIIGAGFVIKEEVGIHSDKPAGTVLETSTEGEGCGALVTLYYALGPCTMPHVIGLTAEEAIALIEDAGFESPELRFQWHDRVAYGLVFDQFPEQGPRLCNFTGGYLKVSLFLRPEWIEPMLPERTEFESGTLWEDPGAAVYVSETLGPVAYLQATRVEYHDGEDWIEFDTNTPLRTDHSPLRITYRYEFQQPDTDEPGILEGSFEFLIVDPE